MAINPIHVRYGRTTNIYRAINGSRGRHPCHRPLTARLAQHGRSACHLYVTHDRGLLPVGAGNHRSCVLANSVGSCSN